MDNYDFIIKLGTGCKPLTWDFFMAAAKRTKKWQSEPIFCAQQASLNLMVDLTIQKKQWARILNCSTTKISGISWEGSSQLGFYDGKYQPIDRISIETLFCFDAIPNGIHWPNLSVDVIATEIYSRFLVFTNHSLGSYHPNRTLLTSIQARASRREVLNWASPQPFEFLLDENHTDVQEFVPTTKAAAVPA